MDEIAIVNDVLYYIKYYFYEVFYYNTLFGWTLVFIIIYLIILGFLDNRYFLSRYKLEIESLNLFSNEFESILIKRKKIDTSKNLFSRINPASENEKKEFINKVRTNRGNFISSDKLRYLLSSSKKNIKNTVIGDYVRYITTFRDNGLKVDVKLLRKYISQREYSNPRLSRLKFLGGQCIMIGMLGTFVGLTAMIISIFNSLPNESDEISGIIGAAQEIKTILSGVQTAFTTTLFGLVGGIVIGRFKEHSSQCIDSFLSKHDDFLIGKLIPNTLTINDQEGSALIGDISRDLKEVFDSVNVAIDSNEKIINGLGDFYEKFNFIIDNVKDISQSESSKFPNVISGISEVSIGINKLVKSYEEKVINLEKIQKVHTQVLKHYEKDIIVNSVANSSKEQMNSFFKVIKLFVGLILMIMILILIILLIKK